MTDIPDDQITDFDPNEEADAESIMEDLRRAREAYEQIYREKCRSPKRIIIVSPPSGLSGKEDG